MSLPLSSLLPFSSVSTFSSSSSSSLPFLQPHRHYRSLSFRSLFATRKNNKFQPSPADDDPPEALEDTSHGISRVQQFERQVSRARRRQEQEQQSSILSSVSLESAADFKTASSSNPSTNEKDKIFDDIDRAIALRRNEVAGKGLTKSNSSTPMPPDDIDQLSAEEVVDLDEIRELQGLTVISSDEDGESPDDNAANLLDHQPAVTSGNESSEFDLDFDAYGSVPAQIVEPKFKMTLAELLDESRVVPLSVYGDLEVTITGVQHDSREVNAGDLFVAYPFFDNDGHSFLSEADKRGAVAVVADKEIDISETFGCKALVVVEDVDSALAVLAAAFYKHPSKNLSVIGVTGTNGKTTTTHLIKAMYEAMGMRIGMLGTIAYYIYGDNKYEATKTTPDAVTMQKMMATMVHNGTEAVVMETSSFGMALNRCNEVDFDIALFTNLTRDHLDFHGTEEEYKKSKGKLFARMVDPERHRKIVNIDDSHAPYFIAQGNPDVPVVTYAMDNKSADVHPLKFELSLFETQVLVKTPQGVLEISSGLIGRHNIYNILAAVAVGIAVGAPLEDIVRGIEEVDGVPGRCELIDEEQAFSVIVDYAHSPDALSRLLDTCRELGPRRIITAFGCGGDRDRGKRPLMTKIATDKSDVTILTSDNPRNEDPLDILDDMLAGVGWTMQDYLKYGENDYYPPLPNGHRLFVHDIRRVAVRAAVAMGEEGDIVVIAGKGHETYQIEGDKKEFFDDREECREALHYVDELHQAGIDTSEFPWRLPESH